MEIFPVRVSSPRPTKARIVAGYQILMGFSLRKSQAMSPPIMGVAPMPTTVPTATPVYFRAIKKLSW